MPAGISHAPLASRARLADSDASMHLAADAFSYDDGRSLRFDGHTSSAASMTIYYFAIRDEMMAWRRRP